ncbi:hypothetical protein [Halobacillus salinus]|uniref:hypothetical protein n=1 Tax=Halobacillus salinus TaxID=192814 RepID=UPI0009A90DFB|nr:hypothetical protein [Halobacillus salinus]
MTQAEFNTASGGSHEKVVENEVVMKESAFSDSDYEQFAVTLTDYELPTEGRLTDEEAKEKLGIMYHPDFPVVAYGNGLVFDEDSHSLTGTYDYKDIKEIVPYGTQVLGLLRSEIDSSSQHKWTVEGYNTVFRMEPLEDLSKQNRESVATGEGWEHLQRGIETQLVILEPFEKQLSEEGYEDLAAWLDETIGYFEQADQFERENWEKAYQWYVQGSNNIDRMEFELGQVD